MDVGLLRFEGRFDFGKGKKILDLLFSFLIGESEFFELRGCIKSHKIRIL